MEGTFEPTEPTLPQLKLYSTEACHLCELAENVLKDVEKEYPSLQVSVVDIALDDALMERYGIRIPVIELENAEYDLGWPFSRDEVIHYLQQFETLSSM